MDALTTSPSSSSHHPPPFSIPEARLNHDGRSDYHASAAAAALAQESNNTPIHIPTPNNTASGKKRKATGAPGSRGVANLTPEQLAKKRANDREAQRAIRERTRNTIESLEQRIRGLEGQQPFQDLQRVVQERDRALAECEELRSRLQAVAGIAGSGLPGGSGGNGGNGAQPAVLKEDDLELAASTAQPPVQLPPLQARPSAPQQHDQVQHSPAADRGSPSAQNGTSVAHTSQSLDSGTFERWSPTPEYPPSAHNSASCARQQSPSHTSSGHQNGERLGLNFLLESTEHQRSSSSPSTLSYHSPVASDQPLYARLTKIGPSSCPLDSLLIDFHKSRRKMLREGISEYEVIGPSQPAFSSMLDPTSHPHSHPTSALLIDILSKFPDISRLPEKVAVLYIMFLILRWEIHPSAENYNRLPAWCRPVPEQLERPHVQWCDYLPWPHMRRQLSIMEKEVKFDDFFVPYTTTLSLNWPYPSDTVLISTPSVNAGEPATLVVNPVFEFHLMQLEHWSLGGAFLNAFPSLADSSVRIRHN